MNGACWRNSIDAAEVQAWIAEGRGRPVLPRPSRSETLADLASRIETPGFVAEITCGDLCRLGRCHRVLWRSVLAVVVSDHSGENIRVCWVDPVRGACFGFRVEREEVIDAGPDRFPASPGPVRSRDRQLS